MSKLTTCLWHDGTAEEAARFYVSLLPGSRIDRVSKAVIDWPAGKAGDTLFVLFTLAGQPYMALNAGPGEKPNPAVSIAVSCEDQAEVDRLWAALREGGREIQCGWLTDRYGLAWQIVPRVLMEMIQDPDAEKARRVTEVMVSMVKLEIEPLRRAYDAG
ncbi:VOC family protein [Enterovirga rhinocerotis]|uniref:Putative 3-demethylubiquinone-9 3-methyltransferase (Glyoxalase superfamily) n=1 Tax=Enterovirga rhinocerotis TaxID=1339210 RepID=A0A4R7C8Z7_9HYPH|nr:VOC family protein [Enterovirga rhinocerotis]TDR94908.1 putative 3-demethylubiquinone-9 3-methyltransferase (glyoxalase superfamily) [Enterovirga rhinocerotis]